MNRYQDQHSDLLKEWQSVRNYEDFSNDGILVEAEWLKAFPKILFLLKESNADFLNICGRGWGPHGNSRVFWRNLNIWSYIITEVWNERLPEVEEIYSVKEKEVNAIAYVNIKKNAECRSISDNNDIVRYAIKDKGFLKRQIDFINPAVIYCCGTIQSFKILYDAIEISPGIYSFNNRLIIDYYHPSCRSSYKTTFNKLSDILSDQECVKEIARIKSDHEKKY